MPIRSLQDVSAVVGRGMEEQDLLLDEADLGAEFFDLRTGIAGELFQKFVNYRIPLALVIPDPVAHGQRFGELALEHRLHPMVRIVETKEEAVRWLADMRRKV